jgi:hypothetical protein
MTSYLEAGCPNGVAIVAEVHAQHETPLVVVHILGTLLTPRHEICQLILLTTRHETSQHSGPGHNS